MCVYEWVLDENRIEEIWGLATNWLKTFGDLTCQKQYVENPYKNGQKNICDAYKR